MYLKLGGLRGMENVVRVGKNKINIYYRKILNKNEKYITSMLILSFFSARSYIHIHLLTIMIFTYFLSSIYII